ncbi:MAG TPA: FAD-dependent monooxygenase, partial [Gammaproteobacteria bacterium]|nr:FAD-dependent monooxygenase [Gammaproteobacteria bacterium]
MANLTWAFNMTATHAQKHFDMIIVGGGVVGLTLALCLARENFTIAIVEKQKWCFDNLIEEYDTRVFAIHDTSLRILDNLGLLQKMRALRSSPFYKIAVWDKEGDGFIEFDNRLALHLPMGEILEQKVLLYALYTSLKNQTNVTFFEEAAIIEIHSKQAHLRLPNILLTADWMLACDGAQSAVREAAMIPWQRYSYQQQAIIATLACEKNHGQTARQAFFSKGTLALLPLKDSNKISLVWSWEERDSHRLMQLSAQDFVQELAHKMDGCLGHFQLLGKRFTYPLYKAQAAKYWQHRCILVGDAAHVIHPLAGQGINLGILDAASLRDIFVEWRNLKKLSSKRLLNYYQRHRRGHSTFL